MGESAGLTSVTWNGRDRVGAVVAPGSYRYWLYVTDAAGNRASPYPQVGTVRVQ